MLPNKFRLLISKSIAALAILLASCLALHAQTTPAGNSARTTPNRLTQPIDESALVTLQKTVHPLTRTASDLGAVEDGAQLDRLQIVLKRSDSQESTLKQLVQDLHTPGTPSYHKWLTPDQFGKQFGPSDADIATLQTWLQSHGFSIGKLNPGRQTLEVSGTAAQFRNTFHAQIHKYRQDGQTHFANASDPQIPAALAPVFGGFASLNNFSLKSNSKALGKAAYNPQSHSVQPSWTIHGDSGYNFVLSPADFAVQYDLNPLYKGGTTGAGQTIAIVNEANIDISLVNNFRQLFHLPANPPQIVIDGSDPGIDGINNLDGPNNASIEAYLDVEWAGAVAPDATVDLVIAGDTALENGLLLAAEHAVYANLAPVVSVSFGRCEAALGAENQFFSNLWEQAAAQGITVLVSTGDSGSAGCDNDNTQEFAVSGAAVNGFATTPYNVAVGGTDFYYSSYAQGGSALSTQLQKYWSFTPSNNQSAVSIQGVIPEQPWNASQYGLNIIDSYAQSGTTAIAGGSGGVSTLGMATTINGLTTFGPYPKPSWQAGKGVPADHARDIPDVALFASSGANATFYPICFEDGDCQPVASGGTVQISAVGGTSASAPSFAGMMALVNQKYGPQGQADFVLYPLAQQFPAAFHDVVNGTNSVPCNITTVMVETSGGEEELAPNDCIPVSNPLTVTDPTFGTSTEGQIGSGEVAEYNATPGYDLASGLGTIDANALVTNWGSVKFQTSSTTLTPSATSFAHGTAITISGAVTGTTTPSGSVALMSDSTEPVQQGIGIFELNNGAYSGTMNTLPGGTYNIWGQYSGDGVNAASTSPKTTITVTPEDTTTQLNVFTPTSSGALPIPSGSTYSYGTALVLSAQPAPATNPPTFTPPTGSVIFKDGSATLSTAALNANGDAEYEYPYAPGQHSITANYLGDQSYKASAAGPVTFTIARDTPGVYYHFSNENSSGAAVAGQSTILTAFVENTVADTGGPAPPTGKLTMTGAPAGSTASASLSAAVDPSNNAPDGVAIFTIPATAVPGTYTITLAYAGDANYNATSIGFSLTVAAAGAGLPSTTVVTASSAVTSPTATVQVTTTVTGQTGHAAPTGTITFSSSGYELGSLALPTGSGASATKSIALTSRAIFRGSNLITVQYSGDATYLPSVGTVTIANPLSDFSLTAASSVVAMPSSGTATDVLHLQSNSGFAGAVNLTCAGSKGVTCTLSASSAKLASGGAASVTLTATRTDSSATGNASISVTAADASGAYVHTLGLQVLSAPQASAEFALSGTALTDVAGASATSTITVTPSGGFTGAVALSCAVTSSPATATGAPTCTVSAPPAITGSAAVTATLTVNSSATTTPGNYTLTVSGTSGSLDATTTVTLSVKAPPPTPSFTLSGTTIASLTPGASGNSTLTVTPGGGFTGSVSLACSITATPTGATNLPICTVPATVSVAGSAAATATLTVATTAATTTAALNRPSKAVTGLAGGIAVAALLVWMPVRARRWSALLGLLLLTVAGGAVIGCGGSSHSTVPPPTGGTTAGSYSITVNASSGTIKQSTVVTVQVN